MEIKLKHFYFIKDEFYAFTVDPFLMENKENGINRPCFLATKDGNGVIWLIPVTSKIEKFQNIYNAKKSIYGSCDSIVIAKLLGRDCAFLIQNMFPISEGYIKEEYIQKSTGLSVSISETLANEITIKFKKVLALVKTVRKVLFSPMF